VADVQPLLSMLAEPEFNYLAGGGVCIEGRSLVVYFTSSPCFTIRYSVETQTH
jgi:hypothetical protein